MELEIIVEPKWLAIILSAPPPDLLMDTKGYHKYLSNGCVTQNILPDRKFRNQQQRRSQSSFGIFKYHRIFPIYLSARKSVVHISISTRLLFGQSSCYNLLWRWDTFLWEIYHHCPWGSKEGMHKDPKGAVQMSLCLAETHSEITVFRRAKHSEQLFFCCLIRQK